MHPYGACYHDLANTLSTGVIEYLRQNAVTTVLVGGLATDYCVKNTVLQLLAAGFAVILNLGACRGISPDSTKEALRQMQEHGAQIISSFQQLQQ
jgi:nicotinamidase/pyrazinamidase